MDSSAVTIKSRTCADDDTDTVLSDESVMQSVANEGAAAGPNESGQDVDQIAAGQVETLYIRSVPFVSITIDGVKRLCLAQISNTLLAKYSYNEIHNRRVALGINCVQCTPVQLELLRRVGAMPTSSRRCGMITHREADRLVRSFLDSPEPPKLPKEFAFHVEHECGWGCKGTFHVNRYTSSRAKCVCCSSCQTFLSPNKFIFHFHRNNSNVYKHPDAANFNSWRRHLFLQDRTSSMDLVHAWEDVKAMFNGGNRKRSLTPGTFSMRGDGAESMDENGPESDNEKPVDYTEMCQKSALEMGESSDAGKSSEHESESSAVNNNDGTKVKRAEKSGASKRQRVTDASQAAEPKKMKLTEKADLHLKTPQSAFYRPMENGFVTPDYQHNRLAAPEEFTTIIESAAAQLLHSQPNFSLLPAALLSPVTPTSPEANNLLLSGLFQSIYQQMIAQSLQQQSLVNMIGSTNASKVVINSSRKNKEASTDYSISKLIN